MLIIARTGNPPGSWLCDIDRLCGGLQGHVRTKTWLKPGLNTPTCLELRQQKKTEAKNISGVLGAFGPHPKITFASTKRRLKLTLLLRTRGRFAPFLAA